MCTDEDNRHLVDSVGNEIGSRVCRLPEGMETCCETPTVMERILWDSLGNEGKSVTVMPLQPAFYRPDALPITQPTVLTTGKKTNSISNEQTIWYSRKDKESEITAVRPVPGAPYRITPFGGLIPISS